MKKFKLLCLSLIAAISLSVYVNISNIQAADRLTPKVFEESEYDLQIAYSSLSI